MSIDESLNAQAVLKWRKIDESFKLARIALYGAIGIGCLWKTEPIARDFAGTNTQVSVNLTFSIAISLIGVAAFVYAWRQSRRAKESDKAVTIARKKIDELEHADTADSGEGA